MQTPRFRAAIEYEIDGDLRFLSHHDEIRMLMRALVRAAWPLAYSEGFNPQPRMSLPLPRRVGTASRAQFAIIDLAESCEPKPLFDALSSAAPGNLPIRGVTTPLPAGTPHPLHACFEINLDPSDAAAVAPRVAELLNLAAIVVTRAGPGKPTREIDVRPLLDQLVLDGTSLRLRLTFDGQRSARPIEILTNLGLPAVEYEHRVRQTEVLWSMELAGLHRWPAAPERNSLVEEEGPIRSAQAALA